MLIKKGKIERQGTPADLAYNGVKIMPLELSEISSNDEKLDENSSETITDETNESAYPKSIVNGRMIEIDGIDEGLPMEPNSKGIVTGSLYLAYFKAGANSPILLILFISFLFVQFLTSSSDYCVLLW